MTTSPVLSITFPPSSENNWIHTPNMRSSFIGKVTGLVKDAFFTLQTLFTRWTHRKNYLSTISDSNHTKTLCVLLHGLNGHPSIFDGYHDALEKKFGSRFSLLQPFVAKRGNCSMEDAAERIYQTVLSWAKENQDKQIVFCGISNGARLAAHIACKLKNENKLSNPIQVNSIAGPFYGSKLANQPNWSPTGQKIWRKLVQSPLGRSQSKEILNELAWASDCAKTLIENMEKSASSSGVQFNFFATRDDSQVLDYHSCFPKLSANANYFLTQNEGHQSVVPAVKTRVLEEIDRFCPT